MKSLRLTALVIALALLAPAAALAGGSSSSYTCNTKYPVILSHGMGAQAQILGIIDYWWGIEPALEDEGANVYITSVNGMDSTATKAAAWKKQLLQILAVTGKAKANVIGHSHGTIYTRYAMTNLGCAGKVATHTSIAGPHKGSSVANLMVYDLNSAVSMLTTDALDFIYTFLFGDTNPDTRQNLYDLCTDYMQNVFNPKTPNCSGVYYQSWAAKAKWATPNIFFMPTWLYMLAKEGDNDGLVSVNSAKWGTFRGVQQAAWWSPGCDHLTIVGLMFGITPGFDAPDFYVDVVSDLKKKGY
ncbi:MAG: alpha/beta fold hydrolase [Thermodesulfobacteriota bacterium]